MSTLNGMKYVVFDEGGDEHIIIFPAVLEHKAFASTMPSGWKPVRAGFVWIYDGVLQCHGESFSLGLQGNSQKDTLMLRKEICKD